MGRLPSKLSAIDVRLIRKSKFSPSRLAQLFGVSQTHIRDIIKYKKRKKTIKKVNHAKKIIRKICRVCKKTLLICGFRHGKMVVHLKCRPKYIKIIAKRYYHRSKTNRSIRQRRLESQRRYKQKDKKIHNDSFKNTEVAVDEYKILKMMKRMA